MRGGQGRREEGKGKEGRGRKGKEGQGRGEEGLGREDREGKRRCMMTISIFSDNTHTSDKDLGVTHVPPSRSASTPRRGMGTHLEGGFQTVHPLSTPVVMASETLHSCPPGTGSPVGAPHSGLGECLNFKSEFSSSQGVSPAEQG